MISRYIFLVLALLSLAQSHLQAGGTQSRPFQNEDIRDQRAQPMTLLRRPLTSPPPSCHVEDFRQSCKTDQRCKERKESCGDSVSSQFNDDLISVTQMFSEISFAEGKYNGNRGFDDIRDAKKSGLPYTFVTENKADSAKLNRKNNQMSYRWVEGVEDKLTQSRRVSSEVDTTRRKNGQEGRVLRSLSHVSLPSPTQPFIQDYGIILSGDPTYRQQEVLSYCVTIHPQIKEEAQRYSVYQTPTQRQNLSSLDRECSTFSTTTSLGTTSNTSRRSSEREVDQGVCYVEDYIYNRRKLHLFISFLHSKYTYIELERAVSNSSQVPARIISGLGRSMNFNHTLKYEQLWQDLTSIYFRLFEQWLKEYKKLSMTA